MGLRLILILLAIWFIINLLRKQPDKPKTPKLRRREGGRMVRCDHCGLYVPEAEALNVGDHHYCSEAHRRLSSEAHGASAQTDQANDHKAQTGGETQSTGRK
ncbi:MAG: PP0621 family protein [Gammaproteobacteria bacterium]